MGLYADPRRPAAEIPGLEYAGTVAALGERVTDWSVGDTVMGIESGGCYAEQVATHARQAMPVPAGLDLDDAAAIPEVFVTAWDALVVQGGLTSGRWALVHAGASGVGTAAIQIAKAIGANVAVTCSAGKVAALSPSSAPTSSSNGRLPTGSAHCATPRRRGGSTASTSCSTSSVATRSTATCGGASARHIVQVGLLGGGSASVNLGALLSKRVTWIGTTLRSRPLEEKLAICRRFVAEVLPLFATGALQPVIDRRFPLDEVAEAHRVMEADANVGKILLDVLPR